MSELNGERSQPGNQEHVQTDGQSKDNTTCPALKNICLVRTA